MPHLGNQDSAGVRLARARGASQRASGIRDLESEQRRAGIAQRRQTQARGELDAARQNVVDFREALDFAVGQRRGSNAAAAGLTVIGLVMGLGVGNAVNFGSSTATLLTGSPQSEEFGTIAQIAGGGVSRGLSMGREAERRKAQGERSRRLGIELGQPSFSREASGNF